MRAVFAALILLLLFISYVNSEKKHNPFIGNTIKARYRIKATRCDSDNKCSVIHDSESNNQIYISNNNDVFAYFTGTSGAVRKISKHYVTDNGGDLIWTLTSNSLISTMTNHGALGTVQSQFIYTYLGQDKCTVGVIATVPNYTVQNDIDVHSCDILPGHADP